MADFKAHTIIPSTQTTKPNAWLDWAALAWCALVIAGTYVLFSNRGFDDSFITYSYAQNLAEGRGFVFNLSERVLSTTTPLFALLLALAHALAIPIPQGSVAIGALANGVGAWCFWQMGKAWKDRLFGLMGALVYPTSVLLLSTLSNESTLYCALGLMAIVLTAHGRLTLAACVVGLLTLTRHDGILLLPMLMAMALSRSGWARGVQISLSLVLPCLLVIGPWFAFATLYFGQPFPVTLVAKQAQGAMTISTRFLSAMPSMLRHYWQIYWYWPQLIAFVFGARVASIKRCGWMWVVAWSMAYVLAYTVLRVTSYFWYYAPLVPGITALIAAGAASLLKILPRAWAGGGAALMALALLIGPLQSALDISHNNDNRLELYRKTGEWLRDNTPQGASVGTLEVGIIGYYSRRRLIDFAGLLQPDVTAQIRPDSNYGQLALYAWNKYAPEYLAAFEGQFPEIESTERFKQHCREVARLTSAKHPNTLLIHACGR